jgi:hypothetical protein
MGGFYVDSTIPLRRTAAPCVASVIVADIRRSDT